MLKPYENVYQLVSEPLPPSGEDPGTMGHFKSA